MRNGEVHMDQWQFSDNRRAYQIKSAKPVPGARKSITNSIFVGFTKNTGHKVCRYQYDNGRFTGPVSYDLVNLRTCSDHPEDDPEAFYHVDTELFPLGTQGPMRIGWWKPIGDVYRSFWASYWYPIQVS